MSGGAAFGDGAYVAVETITDRLGSVRITLPLTIDTTAPVLWVVDAQGLRFSLDEPATVTIVAGGNRIVRAEPKGTFAIGVPGSAFSAQAQDAAGNSSPVVTGP
jgi:hypothetical protein